MRPSDGEEPARNWRQPDAEQASAEPDAPQAGPASAVPPNGENGTEAGSQGCAESETRADAGEIGSTARGKSRNKPHYFKRNRVWFLLLILFVLLGVAAYSLYPRRAAVYRPQPLTVTVGLPNATAISDIFINAWQMPANTAEIDFDFLFNRPKHVPASSPFPARMIISLPHGVIPESCTQKITERQQCVNNRFGSAGSILFLRTSPTQEHPRYINEWSVDFKLKLRSRGLTWSANGLTVEAQLPILKIGRVQGSSQHVRVQSANGDSPVMVNYHLLGAENYDWSGGLVPNSADILAATWNQPLKALSTPNAVSGNDPAAADRDSLHIFLAGILLGVAGSAAVGAIQEFTHRKGDTQQE